MVKEIGVKDEDNDLNKILQDIIGKSMPMAMVARMVMSKARGQDQIAQLVLARGKLDGMTKSIDKALVAGMTWDEAFEAAKNARSSMCDKKLNTAKAGTLTRRLMLALQSQTIVEPDCGTDVHSIENCKCLSQKKGGICQKCYRPLPDGSDPDDGSGPDIGFPIGVIAAQSIGERGTQLSMQSFHSGRSKLRSEERGTTEFEKITKILGDAHNKTIRNFVDEFKSLKPYSKIDDRHFQLLWRVIKEAGGFVEAMDQEKTGDLFAWILARKQMPRLLQAAMQGRTMLIREGVGPYPVTNTLFNLWGDCAEDQNSK